MLTGNNRRILASAPLMKLDFTMLKRLLRFGLPNGISFFLDIASFSAFIFLIGNAGKATMAASNIVLSIEGLSFMPVLGIGIATSTLVGQYIGRQRKEVAIKAAYSCLKLTLAYAISIGVLFVFVPEIFVGLFTRVNPEEFTEIAGHIYPMMKILAFFIFFDAISITFASTIKGAGDTKFQMIMSILCAWLLFVPGIYVILQIYSLPVKFAWLWATFYLAVLALIFFLRFKSNRWQKIDVIAQS